MTTWLYLILGRLEGLSTLLSRPSTWLWLEAVFETLVGFGRPLDRTILSSTSSCLPIIFPNEAKLIKCNWCNNSSFYRSNLKNHTISLFSPAEISTSGDFPRFRSPLSQKTFRWWIVQICQKYLMCWSPPGQLTTPWQADWCLGDPVCKIECSMLTVCTSEGSIVTPQQVTNTPLPPPGGNKRLGPNFCSLSTMPVLINPLPNQQLYQCNLNTC